MISLTVNGRKVSVRADGVASLLSVLRGELGLRGVRFGCGADSCGACMVLLDGEPMTSCTLALERAAGRAVTTPEGLGTKDAPDPLQAAFLDEQAAQCGYCLGGILIVAKALLARNPDPTRAEIAAALEKNLCRCGAHNRMIRAISRAAWAMRREAA
ncbi:MAG TPA: (2Fe-2S)-binding protein [Acetobacteraceae bacterium]|nr:(2Fe-2S)-binding protein [Acetobacteraceae bacterium]